MNANEMANNRLVPPTAADVEAVQSLGVAMPTTTAAEPQRELVSAVAQTSNSGPEASSFGLIQALAEAGRVIVTTNIRHINASARTRHVDK